MGSLFFHSDLVRLGFLRALDFLLVGAIRPGKPRSGVPTLAQCGAKRARNAGCDGHMPFRKPRRGAPKKESAAPVTATPSGLVTWLDFLPRGCAAFAALTSLLPGLT